MRLNGLLRYGTAAQEKTAHLDFNFGGHSWAALTSLTVADFADLQMGRQQPEVYADLGLRPWFVKTQEGVDEVVSNPNPYRQVPSAYSQSDVLQKILFRPSPSVAHSLNLQFSTSSDVPRYDRLTLGSASAPRFSEWYYGPQNRLLAAYHLSLTPKQYWYDQAVLTASYQHIVESRHGWTVWWDRRIPAGETWRSVLEKALENMRCMIVLLSSRSIESEWVYEEATEGRRLGKLVPVMIEAVRPPAGFREIQAADLTNWDGSREFDGMRMLIADLENLLGKPVPATAVSPEKPANQGQP